MLSEHKDAGSLHLFQEIMVSVPPLSWDEHHREQPWGAGKALGCYSIGIHAICKPEMHLALGDTKISCYFVMITAALIFEGKEQWSMRKTWKLIIAWQEMTVEIIKSRRKECWPANIVPKLCDLGMSHVAEFSFMCVNEMEVTQIPMNWRMPLPFPFTHSVSFPLPFEVAIMSLSWLHRSRQRSVHVTMGHEKWSWLLPNAYECHVRWCTSYCWAEGPLHAFTNWHVNLSFQPKGLSQIGEGWSSVQADLNQCRSGKVGAATK